MTYSRRNATRRPCSRDLQTDRDERLLETLRELARYLDPLPEHAAAAARSAFTAAASDPKSSSQSIPCQSTVTLVVAGVEGQQPGPCRAGRSTIAPRLPTEQGRGAEQQDQARPQHAQLVQTAFETAEDDAASSRR
jgi:hypothetical protein